MAKENIVSISKSFMLKGYWFLPEKPERKVAGILTYSPGEMPLLELIGGFDEEPDPMMRFINSEHRMTVPVIHGLTADNKKTTLLDCHLSASFNMSCPFSMESYRCNLLIYGHYIDNDDQEWISESFVELPTIEYFLPDKPFMYSHEECGVINLITTPNDYDNCENTVVVEGVSCCLKNVSVSNINNRSNATFTICPVLRVKSENIFSFNKLYRILSLYSEFLSIATLTPTQCNDISVYCPDEFQDIIGKRIHHSIKIVICQNTCSEPPSVTDILLRYADIKDIYPSIIEKWFLEDEKMGPIKRHLIEVITDRRRYSSVKFLFMIQAVEGYYYRYVKDEKISLKNILNAIIDSFKNVDAISRIKWDVDALVDSRHYYSHFFTRTKKPHTLFEKDLAIATSELRVLLICCMLRIMGFDNARINDIMKKCHSNLAKPMEL